MAKNLLSLGFMIVAVVYMFIAFFQNYRNGIRIWSFTSNDWIYDNKYGIRVYDWGRFIGMILSALANVVGTFFVVYSFQLSIDAGINQGVISSLFVLSAVFSAIFAFIFLGETLALVDYVGMFMMIACAIILSLSQGTESISEIITSERISAIFPVLAGIGSALGFGIRSIFM